MNRRNFIRLSSYSLASLWACHNEYDYWQENKYNISIQSDLKTGHQLFKLKNHLQKSTLTTETLIIGGGIAGLSTAYQLKNKDFILCELSSSLGGSSSAQTYEDQSFTQGAHYDLSYPNYFGNEVLQALESLDIIQFNKLSDFWEFKDKQFIISNEYELQCLENKHYRETLLKNDDAFNSFRKIIEPFNGKLKLPSRIIDSDIQHLNKITFFDFLNSHKELSPELIKGIDYQMLDDFSGLSTEISALAGLYYYTNRPYQNEKLQIFSPPEGNYYFINKMYEKINKEAIYNGHLVYKIDKQKGKFHCLVLDVKDNSTKKIITNNIVYAGQKHSLKYISPNDYKLFATNQYAPWLVVNLIMKDINLEKGYWQNEILNSQRNFMGFVDSDAQHTNKKHRIITAYFCFPSWTRKKMLNIDKWANQFVNQTVENIAVYFGKKPSYLKSKTEKVFIKVMGHAMPIPKPDYLFKDKNDFRPEKNFVYAGVDNGRLPLMFEAMDSGIIASKLIS